MQKDIIIVNIHRNNVYRPTFKSTAAYLAIKESETRIKCATFEEIPIETPYV